MIKLFPTYIAVWDALAVGAGPVQLGLDQAITSKSKIYTSLKKSTPYKRLHFYKHFVLQKSTFWFLRQELQNDYI